MTIQEDAMQILDYIYDKYVNNNSLVGPKTLLEHFHWEGPRIDRAIKYLKGNMAIDIILLLGNEGGLQNFIIRDITPIGIRMAEERL